MDDTVGTPVPEEENDEKCMCCGETEMELEDGLCPDCQKALSEGQQ